MRVTSAWFWSRRTARGLLGVLVLLGVVFAGPPPAQAQQIVLEADQAALTKLLKKHTGKRWVLVKWRGAARLVLTRIKLSITPRGIYLAGTLKSVSPKFSTDVEIRVRPRLRGSLLVIDQKSATVTRPTGVLGYVPRKVLTRFLKSASAAKHFKRLRVDLKPVLGALGTSAAVTPRLKLGFGRISLIVTLR